MAVEGYILPDGTVKPLETYDDTELREEIRKLKVEIDNLKSRTSNLESRMDNCPCSGGTAPDGYLHLSGIKTADVDTDGFIVVDSIPVDAEGYIKVAETEVSSDGYITA